MLRTLLAFLILSTVAAAQTAKVIQLDPADAEMLQGKWKALKLAEKEWEDAKFAIDAKYLYVGKDDPDAGSGPLLFLGNINSACVTTENGGVVAFGACPGDEKRRKMEEKKQKYLRKGWDRGSEPTTDFKFIVPKLPSPALPTCSPTIWGGNGIVGQQVFTQ